MNQKLLNSLPDIALIGAIAGAYLLDTFIPIIEAIQPSFSYAGWLLVVAGIVFAARSLALLRKDASSDVVRTSQFLITHDVFALSRNPLYASELLVIIGIAVILGSLGGFIAPVTYAVIMARVVIPFEESQLRKKFGVKYKVYARSVRRWV